MNRRAFGVAIFACASLLAAAITVHAGGFGLGLFVYTIDLADAFAKVPTAAEAAFDALDDALADLGLSPADRAEIRQGFDEGLAEVVDGLAGAPTVYPVPLLGGTIEFSLPLALIDGISVSGGFLTDGLLRGFADLAGVSIPSPLVDVEFDEEGLDGSFVGDVSFGSWIARTDLVKRLDVLVAALGFGVGVHVAGGAVSPRVEIDVPTEIEDGVAAALEAVHLDGLTWTSFGVHASVGIEIGPPFLRLGAQVQFVLPISVSSGWWGIGVGGIGGGLRMVIRF